MKATFKFNLPEEQWEYDATRQGPDLVHAITDFQNEIRNHFKYKKFPHWDSKTVEEIQQVLMGYLNNHSITDL